MRTNRRFFKWAIAATLCAAVLSPREARGYDFYRIYDFMAGGLAYRLNDDGKTLAVVEEQPRGLMSYEGLLDGSTASGDADVNGDGVVSGADVTALYNLLLGQ